MTTTKTNNKTAPKTTPKIFQGKTANLNFQELISYGSPKVIKGATNIPVLNKAHRNYMSFQTPPMYTWGIKNSVDAEKRPIPTKWEMTLAFPNETTPDSDLFLENLKNYHTNTIDSCFTNHVAWFKKSAKNRDVVESNVGTLLKYPKNKETGEPDESKAPTISVKVPLYAKKDPITKQATDEYEWGFSIFKENGTKTPDLIFDPKDEAFENVDPVKLIPERINVRAIIESDGIWCVNGKYYSRFRLKQLILPENCNDSNEEECLFELDGTDDDDDDESPAQPKQSSKTKEVQLTVEESDDEEDTPPAKPTSKSVEIVDESDDEGNGEKEEGEDEESEEVAQPEPEPEPEPEPVKTPAKKPRASKK